LIFLILSLEAETPACTALEAIFTDLRCRDAIVPQQKEQI
jgi:hypothetical protein